MLPKIPKHLEKRTGLYGKIALVIGEHQHAGKTAKCKGAFKWANRWYMVFEDTKTKLQFIIDSPSNIAWVETKDENKAR